MAANWLADVLREIAAAEFQHTVSPDAAVTARALAQRMAADDTAVRPSVWPERDGNATLQVGDLEVTARASGKIVDRPKPSNERPPDQYVKPAR